MIRLRAKSIAGKLTMMNILVSAGALLVCCAAFVTYDVYSFRDAVVRNLTVQAQIVGFNSISAITFNDPQSAENTLSAFSATQTVNAAGILLPDGRLFAVYPYTATPPKLPSDFRFETEQHWFSSGAVLVNHPIDFQGKIVGAVYIRSNLSRLYDRIYRYALIAVVVLLASLVAALVLSSLFRRAIAEPVITLAETARSVSRQRDYSVRAAPSGEDDELGTLISAFNEMLAEIQSRDVALRTAHDQLEQRVTERTKELVVSNQQLEQRTRELVFANQELEAFSYSVSHDLRSPLEVINGFTYLLETEWGSRLDQSGRECLSQVRTSSQKMAELIDDLLNLSRVSTSPLQQEVVDLSGIARSLADDLQRRAPERNVEFVIADGARVLGDPRFLHIVMDNLLRNAWKYTSHHPQARIEFGFEVRTGERVYFVRDDGAGFDAARSNRLFKPFQRLHSEAEFSGNGVGLATVQRIIQRHNGHIWATAAIEKGATFYFSVGTVADQTNKLNTQKSAAR